MDTEPDYVTYLDHADDHRKKLVAIMHWQRDEWVIRKCSRALAPAAAKSLAECWAFALGLEIRE